MLPVWTLMSLADVVCANVTRAHAAEREREGEVIML